MVRCTPVGRVFPEPLWSANFRSGPANVHDRRTAQYWFFIVYESGISYESDFTCVTVAPQAGTRRRVYSSVSSVG